MTFIGSQAPFTLLVANLDRPAMPEKNISARKIRTGFSLSHLQSLGQGTTMQGGSMVVVQTGLGLVDAYAEGAPTRPEGTVTVVSNTFSGDSAHLRVGQFTLVSNVHFTPGGGVDATATALAAAITLLPGYSALAVGPLITIQGPAGALGLDLRLEAEYLGGAKNYTLTWLHLQGFLGYVSNPPISAPGVLP